MVDSSHTELEQDSSPYINVAADFVRNLAEKGLAIESVHHENMGVVAIRGTNESGDASLFEKVRLQEHAPNGYLIGIGAANVFSMLEAFPLGVEPKAILLFDIDPRAITEGQAIIEHFRQSDSYPEHIFGNDAYSYSTQVFPESATCQLREAVKKYAPLLHKLAVEGRIGITRADFTDHRLIPEFKNLPDIATSNNVIYLSNISDHIWRAQGLAPDFSFLNTLTPNPPNRNIYIDTLTKGLAYNLRLSSTPPHFELNDFGANIADLRFQTKPTDLIDGSSADPVWEDVRHWSLDRLLDTYDDFSSRARQQSRKDRVERSMSMNRQHLLKNYSRWKDLNGKPEKVAGKFEYIYTVPTNPEEEQDLLTEAAEPYDYDRDFIPVLAREYWADATTPLEASTQNLTPRIREEVRDPETGIITTTSDLINYKKAPLTLSYLRSADIYYEELVLAKIYSEVAKRLLSKNPNVETTAKDVNRLVQELQFGRPA